MKVRIRKVMKLLFALNCFVIFLSFDVAAQCPVNVNLITNGDAEAQQGLTGNTNHDVDGWEPETGAFTVIRYGEPGNFPTAASPGPAIRGNYFISGGPSSALATATQSVNISGCAALIDTGNLEFNLSGYFGGLLGQNDRARLDVQFFNGSDIQIGLTSIGPVTNSDRSNSTGLLQRALTGAIPIATRSITFVLFIIPQAGDNDGYADNLSFVIPLGPTAAEVAVGGRVTDQYGRAVSRARVSIADVNGTSRTVITNPFGYFTFTEVEAGQSYVIAVAHKSYSFTPQLLNVSDNVSDLLFVAE